MKETPISQEGAEATQEGYYLGIPSWSYFVPHIGFDGEPLGMDIMGPMITELRIAGKWRTEREVRAYIRQELEKHHKAKYPDGSVPMPPEVPYVEPKLSIGRMILHWLSEIVERFVEFCLLCQGVRTYRSKPEPKRRGSP